MKNLDIGKADEGKADSVDIEIQNLQEKAEALYKSGIMLKDESAKKKKLRDARVAYLGTAERAESSTSVYVPKGIIGAGTKLFFAESATDSFRKAGDIAKELGNYEDAASDYTAAFEASESEMELRGGYVETSGNKKYAPSKEDLAEGKYLKKAAKKMTRKASSSGLIRKMFPSFLVLVLVASVVFSSPSITGNVVANLMAKTSSVIGVGLFVVGVVGSYYYFRKK